jgi:hypothetical protein
MMMRRHTADAIQIHAAHHPFAAIRPSEYRPSPRPEFSEVTVSLMPLPRSSAAQRTRPQCSRKEVQKR